MTASVVEQVRQIIDETRARGEEPPGRPTLVRLTGAKDHQVRQALAELARAGASIPPAVEDDGQAGTVIEAPEPGDVGPAEKGYRPVGTPGGLLAPADTDAGASDTSPGARLAPAGGKFVSWLGFVFGALVSVAANILAARIPPEHASPLWHPNVFAQVGAAAWPLFLLITVEVMSRVNWPKQWFAQLVKYGGVGTVGLVNAGISYSHVHEVLVSWNYPPTGAALGPLGIDGLMIVCGFAMLVTRDASAAEAGASTAHAGARAGDRR